MRLICQICQICRFVRLVRYQMFRFSRLKKKRETDGWMAGPTDRPTDGRRHPLIEMRGRIFKETHSFGSFRLPLNYFGCPGHLLQCFSPPTGLSCSPDREWAGQSTVSSKKTFSSDDRERLCPLITTFWGRLLIPFGRKKNQNLKSGGIETWLDGTTKKEWKREEYGVPSDVSNSTKMRARGTNIANKNQRNT